MNLMYSETNTDYKQEKQQQENILNLIEKQQEQLEKLEKFTYELHKCVLVVAFMNVGLAVLSIFK